jgi:hypothetical protein
MIQCLHSCLSKLQMVYYVYPWVPVMSDAAAALYSPVQCLVPIRPNYMLPTVTPSSPVHLSLLETLTT